MGAGSGMRPSTGFKIADISCDEDTSERVVIILVYAIVVAMVVAAAVSGWITNNKIQKLREERVTEIEQRVETLEAQR